MKIILNLQSKKKIRESKKSTQSINGGPLSERLIEKGSKTTRPFPKSFVRQGLLVDRQHCPSATWRLADCLTRIRYAEDT